MTEKSILFLIILVVFAAMIVISSAEQQTDLIEIEQFLINDTTNQHEYLPWYTCGHYARDLARNATMHNLSIGSVILGNHPVFGDGYNSHLVNYVMINNTIIIICPQTDSMFIMNPGMLFDGKSFKYYRLYPDGTQIPSNWNCNLAHTGEIV